MRLVVRCYDNRQYRYQQLSGEYTLLSRRIAAHASRTNCWYDTTLHITHLISSEQN